jgi:hypothetical protein
VRLKPLTLSYPHSYSKAQTHTLIGQIHYPLDHHVKQYQKPENPSHFRFLLYALKPKTQPQTLSVTLKKNGLPMCSMAMENGFHPTIDNISGSFK